MLLLPLIFTFLRLVSCSDAEQRAAQSLPKLLVVSVATNETDGFRRFRQSAEHFRHHLHVFGMGAEWRGGNMETTGGGQKIRLLREGLTELSTKEASDTLVMFTDAYDVILTADAATIVQRFLNEFDGSRLVFGAEPYCWPDKTLANKYPQVTFGERFLNSGGFIGYLQTVLKLLNEHSDGVTDTDDDQLFYSRLYIHDVIRERYKMTLDSLSRIFQNLNGIQAHVKVEADKDDGSAWIFNSLYNTHPAVIHGNGPSKLQLNSFGNYIADQYNLHEGCKRCKFKLDDLPEPTPLLFLSVFVTKPTPYVEEFLIILQKLNYPRDQTYLYIFNNQEQSRQDVQKFVETYGHEYKTMKTINMDVDLLDERRGRTNSIDQALESHAEFYLSLDADVHLVNTDTINLLVRQMHAYALRILAPMVLQPGKLFSNFWGAIQANGYYERSEDYVVLVERKRQAYWNVPFVSSVYMIARSKLRELREAYWFDDQIDADLSFAAFCRHYQHFMHVDNQEDYGFLVESEYFAQLNSQTLHREIYDYPHNKKLWETRYIHPLYWDVLRPENKVDMVCPDVYDFPLVSERFASEIIAIMEGFGKWSSGNNEDERLAGGYENVPTRDIHMKQVGLHTQFLSIIDEYVAPVQEKVFYGYYQRPINSDMIFVVRYRPDEQASLRPHLDASTYSLDVALNKRGVDYEGGGVRYLRYNCTVAADRVGWSMLFPGRLTHLHEGLPTTKGTRYILVSFINP